jgi:hypothetical protein
MLDPVSKDELDWLIWRALRDQDWRPSKNGELIAAAGGNPLWRLNADVTMQEARESAAWRINDRVQAMRRAGRVRFHRHGSGRPAHVRSHGWEVLGCPGAGIQEDGQFDWAYGCADCQRRVRPDPVDGVVEPPPIVAFECHLRIEP